MSRKNNGSAQVIAYVCRYILDPSKNKLLVPAPHHSKETMQVIIRHNLRARSNVKSFIAEFAENEKYRLVNRKDSVKLFHTVIAFGKGDKAKITTAILKDIGQRFIELRGTNNLYLGTAHYNTDSTHLHIVVSGTQLNGRSSRISRQEHQRIKVALERYQREKYPELIHSRVGHREFIKQPTKEQIIALVQQNRQTTKAAICACLQGALETSNTLKDFLAQITAAGYQPYYRAEKLQGVMDENDTKFRFSRLGFGESVEELQTRSIAEEQSLNEIQKIRKGKENDLRRVMQSPVRQVQVNGEEKKLLDEVVAIRSNSHSKEELLERLVKIPTLFDELSEPLPETQQDNVFDPLYSD